MATSTDDNAADGKIGSAVLLIIAGQHKYSAWEKYTEITAYRQAAVPCSFGSFAAACLGKNPRHSNYLCGKISPSYLRAIQAFRLF